MVKYLFVFIAIASCFTFFSCSSDSSTNNNSGTLVLGTLQATVDGKSWKSQQAMATKIPGDMMYQITGASISGATESLSLTITNINPGTYNNGIGFLSVIDLANPMAGKNYANAQVTYTITESSATEVSGTFSFVAENSTNASDKRKVENGKFRTKFVN